jgi:hypothetical protein
MHCIKETLSRESPYNIRRKLSKRKYQGMQPIKNKDGALIKNKDNQMKRWQEYFKDILNPTVIEMIPTTSPPTERCDNEEEEEEKRKTMERPSNKDEINPSAWWHLKP